MKKLLLSMCLAMTGFANQGFSQSVSHSYINTSRSSWDNHIFVSQAVEGEFGTIQETGDFKDPDTKASIGSINTKWQGYNMTSTLGLELMKFIQFTLSHSTVNLKTTKSSLEHLTGSRVSAGARFVFLAPIGNLEGGGGIIGTRYDYQKDLETSGFYGSGFYYSLGINYFISDRVSVFGLAKMISEHSTRSGGNSEANALSANTTNLGLGFSLWL